MTDAIQPPADAITPADWAAVNPQSILGSVQAVIEAVAIGEDALIDGAVHDLREAMLSEPDEKLVGEVTLVEAAKTFIRAHKAHKMFGDGLEAAADALRAVIAPPANDVDEPYLYILMRNDLSSMNAGKAVAQGSHAANQMVWDGVIATDPLAMALDPERANALAKLISEWSRLARGFGTCIVLSVNEREMRETVAAAQAAGLHANLTHDPSYPLWDRPTLHLIPLDTCAYVFGRKSEARPFVGKFPLMP